MYISLHINKKFIFSLYFIIGLLSIAIIILFGFRNAPTSAETEKEYTEVPILMYHGILDNTKKQSRFVISSDAFESDLKYLKDNGYTSIFMKDLIEYVYKGKKLPPKPIMITFDDGYYNNYLYAFPLLKEYKMKMVLSPIGICVDEYSQNGNKNPNYAHVSWDNIKEMVSSGYVEIQNHTYDMHKNSCGRNGSKKKKNESIENYKDVLVSDVSKMQQEIKDNIGVYPDTFVYPFGAVSNVSVEILKDMGFKATLGCENRMNKIYINDKECLYGLCRYIRPSGVSSEYYFNKKLNLN